MMYAIWDMKYNRHNFLSFWAIFCHFTPLVCWGRKLKFGKNVKKNGNIILLHMCTINEDHIVYDSWNIRHNRQFFVILGHFLLVDPPNNQKNQNFEKMKKALEDIILPLCTTNYDHIILPLCTANDNHMMYGFLDMECDRIFFVILDYFLSFYLTILPPSNPENQKFWKNEKKPKKLEISFSTCVPKMKIIRCMVPEIWSVTDITTFCFFCPP